MLTFIEFSNGVNTIVFGVSYGTVVVERFMLLNPPSVNGYVLDSVATASGPGNKFPYYSRWDIDVDDVGDQFMKLCAEDTTCNSHFPSNNLSVTLENLLTKMDSDPNSTCATLLRNSTHASPSIALRQTLSTLLMDTTTRTLIPPMVYRLARCNTNDLDVLAHFFREAGTTFTTSQDSVYASDLLFYLIIYSDMWETPAPSISEMKTRFTNSSIANGLYTYVYTYCAFSKEKSPTCDKLNTHPKYAEYLFDALVSTKKELITFDYTPHAVVGTTPFVDSNGTRLDCGRELLASYVRSDGDLERLDRSCTGKMAEFNLTVPIKYLRDNFATDKPYDGAYNAGFIPGKESA
ncbi:hypothetical protein L915_17980 [Phytophthora nicotianae]|uniref:Peptidase S33 tripeptidyl aminopeptidase-like C-terminal domain-containing protein n=1 Tax=Phytophthora nicotianae TaxID=4792 RepID=W2FZC1_PHYNI|nr:hypothetical protein L915_17980 [Phytophthora nicotianae]